MAHGRRFQHHRIDETEDRGVGADARASVRIAAAANPGPLR
jgi:hypothetical protein